MTSKLIHVPLDPLDHLPRPTYIPNAVYFGIKPGVSPAEVFQHLQEGLYRAFLQVPWMNGKVHQQSRDTPGWRPGQLEIRYDPDIENKNKPKCPQFHFNELNSDTTYDDLKARGFPLDVFTDEDVLWIPPSYVNDGVPEEGVEVVAAQANFLPGACILVSSMHHSACDATGMALFFKLWGDHCRALSLQSQGNSISLPVLPSENWDRAVLHRLWTKEAKEYPVRDTDPSIFPLIGLDRASDGEDPFPPGRARLPLREKVLSTHVFYMSPMSFKKLVKNNMSPETAEFSGNDILVALLWQNLMKARIAARRENGPETEEDLDCFAELQVAQDARPYFSQELPPFYVGNCCVHHRPTIPLKQLVGPESSIASVAQAIRNSARIVNHETTMDAYNLLRQIPDYSRLHPLRFITVKDTFTISSMLLLPEVTPSFGDNVFTNGGCPEGSRPLMSNRNKSQVPVSYVMPRKKNGGIEFTLSLYEDEWPFLLKDKEFKRYALLMA